MFNEDNGRSALLFFKLIEIKKKLIYVTFSLGVN
jgi:hypothetical protein